MPEQGPRHRRGAINRRRRWSAALLSLIRPSQSSSAGRDSDISASNQRLQRLSTQAFGEMRPTVRIPTEHPFIFPEDLRHRPASTFAFVPAPVAFQASIQVPNSPAPSYHSLGHFGTPRSTSPRRSLSILSVSDSLAEYNRVEQGPPTDHEGYSNYVPLGIETSLGVRDPAYEITIGLESSYWTVADAATDPDQSLCPGFIDGSCSIDEPHNVGLYYWEGRAPSRYLKEVLLYYEVADVFEGGCPPPTVWWALIQGILKIATEEDEDFLIKYMWWHCPRFQSQVRAQRRYRLNLGGSPIRRRRIAPRVNEDQGSRMIQGSGRIVVTDVFLPMNLLRSTWYLEYGFLPPSEAPLEDRAASSVPYPPCNSALCPIPYPHPQGPLLDSGLSNHPISLTPGPRARLFGEIEEYGFSDLFPPGSGPPLFILAAVVRVLEEGPTSNALDVVERFRFFHCRGFMPIVTPDEDTIDQYDEEETEELPKLFSPSDDRLERGSLSAS